MSDSKAPSAALREETPLERLKRLKALHEEAKKKWVKKEVKKRGTGEKKEKFEGLALTNSLEELDEKLKGDDKGLRLFMSKHVSGLDSDKEEDDDKIKKRHALIKSREKKKKVESDDDKEKRPVKKEKSVKLETKEKKREKDSPREKKREKLETKREKKFEKNKLPFDRDDDD